MHTLDNKKLNDYLTAWNLSDPQFLTQTVTSHIYTVTYETETVILKLLSPSEVDEQRGAVALRCFDGHATYIIAQVIQQLHGVPQNIPQDGLIMLERWFEALFNKAVSDRQMGIDSIYVHGASLAEQLLVDPREVRVLHGDIHHRNIRKTSRGWLTFDPKGLIG